MIRKREAFIVAILALAALALRFHTSEIPIGPEEGRALISASAAAAGAEPYRDFAPGTAPMVIAVYGAGYSLFGPGIEGVRTLGSWIFVACAAILYMLVRYFSGIAAASAAVTLYFLFQHNPALNGYAVTAPFISQLFVLSAIFFAIERDEESPGVLMFVGGFLAAAALFSFVPAGALILLAAAIKPGKKGKRILPATLWVSGFVVMTAAALIWAAAAGKAAHVIEYYAGVFNSAAKNLNADRFSGYWIQNLPIAVGAALCCAFAFLRRDKYEERVLAISCLLVIAASFFTEGKNAAAYMAATPLLCALAGAAAGEAFYFARAKRGSAAAVSAIFLLLLVSGFYYFKVSGQAEYFGSAKKAPNIHYEAMEAGRFAAEQGAEKAGFYSLSNQHQSYFYARTFPGTFGFFGTAGSSPPKKAIESRPGFIFTQREIIRDYEQEIRSQGYILVLDGNESLLLAAPFTR